MKTKFLAVVIVAMFALSMMPAFSYEPSEDTVLYIDPQKKKVTGPCTESQTFEYHVMIWNVENLYAWDITITWDTTYINITSYHIKTLDFPVSGYSILIDDYTAGKLQFAVTRLGNVSGYDGSGVATALLNFEVHIEHEPCWWPCDGCVTTYIVIDDYELSTDGKIPPDPIIPDIVEDGEIKINPSKPNMEVLFSDEFDLEAKKAQGWYEGQVITAYVWVSNATKLYGIGANVVWDPDLLKIDLQQITINEEAFPQPWEELWQYLSDGYFDFWILRSEEKPPLKGTFWILKMDFKVKCLTKKGVPIPDDTLIWLDPETTGLWMCDHWYDWPDALDLSDVTYFWTPIPYDFDQNGHVGVEDIMIILDHYGETPSPGKGFDFNPDGLIDIYDIVIVAKHYCNDEPPEMPDP